MKNIKTIVMISISVLILLVISIKTYFNRNEIDVDTINFKQEYEALNDDDNYLELNIPDNNPMVYATFNDVEKIISEGTGVIYFGFPECPWCRNVVPHLIEASKEVGLDKIYYFNAVEMRDIKKLNENGEIITEKEATAEYKTLINLLYEHLEPYDGLKDETIKRLYFPTVIFVKTGEIIGVHTGTVDSQVNPLMPLNESQSEELKGIYTEYMLQVLGIICNTDTKDKC